MLDICKVSIKKIKKESTFILPHSTLGGTLTVAEQSHTLLPSLFFLLLITASPCCFSTLHPIRGEHLVT